MARIGKKILTIPAGVEIKVEGGRVTVKGAKATLTQTIDPVILVKIDGGKVTTVYTGDDKQGLSLQGTYNSLINNMIQGVTKGFEKTLDLVGVGYRAALAGKKLSLQLGYSHPVEVDPPAGVTFEVAGGTRIIVRGADRQKVGQTAAEIRLLREVEPYKGKGIKYLGEIVRRKAGKAAKAGAGGGAA
ncbi:MAG TPA: 50S ribosomal protein L6 [Candidatus Sulfotelmatobacter sp.]|nr:50S ribosomal protein L6 [Candidatus Sulfotelmatobacter sp.]